MIALLLQLTVGGAVTANVVRSDAFYRDREVFAARYRVSLGHRWTVEAGGMLAAENGLFPSKSGAQVRHWAVGIDKTVPMEAQRCFMVRCSGRVDLRFGLSHGRIVEERSNERLRPDSLPEIAYYSFVAGSMGLHSKTVAVTVEKLIVVWNVTGLGLNNWIVRVRSRPLDCILRQTVPDAIGVDASALDGFWSGSCRLLPFRRLPFGVEAGQRPVLGYREPTSRLRYVALGVWFGK